MLGNFQSRRHAEHRFHVLDRQTDSGGGTIDHQVNFRHRHLQLGHGVDQLATSLHGRHVGSAHQHDVSGPIEGTECVVADPTGGVEHDRSAQFDQTIDHGERIGGLDAIGFEVIIGKPGRSTPLLETTIERIEFNPYWDVPTSIQHDVVQKALKHGNIANYFRNHGYRMIVGGEEVNPSTNNTNYRIRQDPGEGNMLGRIMFVLKNTGGVQMHDTPMKNLFNEDVRRFSSGCIRVENAVALASYILEISEEEVMTHINEGRNKYVPVKKFVSVKIVD